MIVWGSQYLNICYNWRHSKRNKPLFPWYTAWHNISKVHVLGNTGLHSPVSYPFLILYSLIVPFQHHPSTGAAFTKTSNYINSIPAWPFWGILTSESLPSSWNVFFDFYSGSLILALLFHFWIPLIDTSRSLLLLNIIDAGIPSLILLSSHATYSFLAICSNHQPPSRYFLS